MWDYFLVWSHILAYFNFYKNHLVVKHPVRISNKLTSFLRFLIEIYNFGNVLIRTEEELFYNIFMILHNKHILGYAQIAQRFSMLKMDRNLWFLILKVTLYLKFEQKFSVLGLHDANFLFEKALFVLITFQFLDILHGGLENRAFVLSHVPNNVVIPRGGE